MNALEAQFAPRAAHRAQELSVVIIGAVASTEAAISSAARTTGWQVRLIVTLPPDRAARHSDFRDLAQPARDAGADLLHAARINDTAVIDRIAAAVPDLVLVIGWSQICGPDLLDRFAGRILGYHPAALPRLRGRAAIPWTILAGEPITAGTLFWIDRGVDSGAIFEQQFFHVASDETAQSLYDKHLAALGRLVSRALARVGEGDTRGEPQDERYATYAAKRTPADGAIDWTQRTDEIACLVRAVGRPYPGAHTCLAGAKVTFWSARPVSGGGLHLARPGQIVERGDRHLLVRTVDGLLRVDEWETDQANDPKLHQIFG
ncbi:methionyl-tRNA formyltransferase [Sphingomonas koreensis]|nr:methionyl-tRNA formyltransferase [Sphingomonas koreensis]